MRTIALFLPNWIGDVVMATPAIRAVRTHFPQSRLLAVCKPYVADTLGGAPWFDDVIPLDKTGPRHRRFGFVRSRLADERLDAAVLFPNSFRVALLASLAGSRTIIGYARYFRDAFLTRRLYAKRGLRGSFRPTPILRDYNRLVEQLGVSDPGTRMELFTTPVDDSQAERFWLQHGLNRINRVIGLNPGGAFGAAKHWPTEHFAVVARHFGEQRSTMVVVLCGPRERDEAQRIATQSGCRNVVTLAETPQSIGLTKAIVRRLQLLITTDSGPRHFAAAFGVPVVSLFGPTHIAWTDTNFAAEQSLQLRLPCGPCQQRVCPLGHHRCMTELLPARVISTAQELLACIPTAREVRHVG